MTTHIWKISATGLLYNPAIYADGQPFEPGDTLVFDSGTGQWTGAMDTGTYLFNGSGGSNSLSLTDATLDGSSMIAESGAGQLLINSFGQFVNNGSLEAGTNAAAGSVALNAYANCAEAGSITNNGQITVQNGSMLQILPYNDTTLMNAAPSPPPPAAASCSAVPSAMYRPTATALSTTG